MLASPTGKGVLIKLVDSGSFYPNFSFGWFIDARDQVEQRGLSTA